MITFRTFLLGTIFSTDGLMKMKKIVYMSCYISVYHKYYEDFNCKVPKFQIGTLSRDNSNFGLQVQVLKICINIRIAKYFLDLKPFVKPHEI